MKTRKALQDFCKLLADARKNPDKTRRLVRKAHLVRLKKRLMLPDELKRAYCTECFSLANWQKRVRKGNIVQTCRDCGAVTRFKIGT